MSITEIAERAGVSISTVSLVINDKPSVAHATAEAVREVIREMGYKPAPLERRKGRRIKAKGALRLAVIANMPGHWLSSPVFADVLHGLEIGAREHGANLLLHQVADGGQNGLALASDEVNGLILFGGQPTVPWFGELIRKPCVRVMGSPDEESLVDHVTYKNSAIGAIAARHLLNFGHWHMAHIAAGGHAIMRERETRFAATVTAAGGTALALDGEDLVKHSESGQMVNRPLVNQLINDLLAAQPRPTALFITADIAVAPIYMHLLQRGLLPGHDLEIVSCNNESSLLNGLDPRPAVVDIHAREVGRRALERLLWRIKNPNATPSDILLCPTLVPARAG